jgi:tRNA modification GTPase
MILPALDDTIVALSTGWSAAPLGVLRLSGPRALEIACSAAGCAAAAPPAGAPSLCETVLRLPPDVELPATLLIFHAPRSYTGQDVVEIHTVGCLPLLHELAGVLIDQGARRALPGEFTARAFLNGRLDAAQVDGIFGLIHAADGSAARLSARLSRGLHARRLRDLTGSLTDLLALVEAGIDFVEEEDIRFITAEQLRTAVNRLLEDLSDLGGDARFRRRAGMPHVALAGLPNAGKSTLFNALLGCERAITSPVLGTTRDVLSAEVLLGGVPVVLQDCAGLGSSPEELERAAHLAAELAADQADLVLWVHDSTQPWTALEEVACARIPQERRILVLSKQDQAGGLDAAARGSGESSAAGSAGGAAPSPGGSSLGFVDKVFVSAARGLGMDLLSSAIRRALGGRVAAPCGHAAEELREARVALVRLLGLIRDQTGALRMPELAALELRSALERVRSVQHGPLAEEVLGRIFSQFCVGK